MLTIARKTRSCFFITIFSILMLFIRCSSHESKKANTVPEIIGRENTSDTFAFLRNFKNSTQLNNAGYKIFQVIKPQMLPNNKQVTVYIIQDKRIKGLTSFVKYFRDLHAARLIFQSDEELFNPDTVFKQAILLVSDSEDKVISYHLLDVPCAKIDSLNFDGNRPKMIYLYTLDYSTIMGSYSGPATYFADFADTGIICYSAAFATTLKSEWAIKNEENGFAVWSKRCRPGNGDEFDIYLEKSKWNGHVFESDSIVKKGIWESDYDENESEEQKLKQFFDDF